VLAPTLRRGQPGSQEGTKSPWTDSSEGGMTLSVDQIELVANCIWGAMMSVVVGLMLWASDDRSEVEP
jgi:hypothetical protein